MSALSKQHGFTFLSTMMVIISVFLLLHAGLSMRMQQKANFAHRGLIKLQTDWLAASAVEQALASYKDVKENLLSTKEYVVPFAASYIANDPLKTNEMDTRVRTALCRFTIQKANSSLQKLGIQNHDDALIITAKATAPYREASIQSELTMLCVKSNGKWTTLPVVK